MADEETGEAGESNRTGGAKGKGGKQPRKSPDPEPRGVVLAVRGRRAWKEWLDRLASYDRVSVNALIDRATAHYARSIGFKEAPPER